MKYIKFCLRSNKVKIVKPLVCFLLCLLIFNSAFSQANPETYLADLKKELVKEWPKNRTINLVFHGHSVPSGYFKTPIVNTFQAYPFLSFKQIKDHYPTAVINFIVTGIGGENSINGEKRFADVLAHKPDVLFIDYALNDRPAGLEKSKIAMVKMIEAALAKNIKVILLTPTPHQNYNMLANDDPYLAFTNQVIELAKHYNIGLVDSYQLFKTKLQEGNPVTKYMSQVNHPNKVGHQLVADEIYKWFK